MRRVLGKKNAQCQERKGQRHLGQFKKFKRPNTYYIVYNQMKNNNWKYTKQQYVNKC